MFLYAQDEEAIIARLYKRESAIALLVNEAGDFFLLQRNDDPAIPYPREWFPISGKKEPEDDTTEVTARREIMEEIGYAAKDLALFCQTIDRGCSGFCADIYAGSIDKKREELHLTEGQNMGFFSLQEIHRLSPPRVIQDIFDAFSASELYTNIKHSFRPTASTRRILTPSPNGPSA